MSTAKKILNEVGTTLIGGKHYRFVDSALTSWRYPIDLAFTLKKANQYYPDFDRNGIPTKDHGDGVQHYNPTRIAAYGLAHHDKFIEFGRSVNLETFLRVADWFMAREDAVWTYDFDWRTLTAPWTSAMAQGVGISVLVRAFNLTRKASYLDHAAQATLPLSLPLSSGGLRSSLPTSQPFLEEYPTQEPKHVLNGFLYTLFGLIALDRIDSKLHDAVGLSSLVVSLNDNLALWDLGYWSAYDLDTSEQGLRNIASLTYHRVHIAQLSYVGRYFDMPGLLQVADTWRAHQDSLLTRLRSLASRTKYLRATGRM